MLKKLTKAFIEKLPFEESGQKLYRDSVLKGFGIRVGKTSKVYFAEAKLDSRTIRKSIGRHDVLTIEDARIESKKILAQIAAGQNPQDEIKARRANIITLGEVVEDYISTRSNLKPSTIQDYRHTFSAYLGDWLKKPIKLINKDMVEARFKKISETSPSQANKTMRNFRAIYNFAMGKYEDSSGDSLFKTNPTQRLSQLRMWHRVSRRKTLIKHYELKPWYDAVMNLSNTPSAPNRETIRDYLLFVLFTGLRRREATTLKWNQVDFKDRTFIVLDTKNHSDHTLPLTDYLYDLLAIRKSKAVNQYVFHNLQGTGPLDDPKKQIKNVIDESGVSFTTHDLRRTFITIAESLDISMYALKRLLNHKMNDDVTAGYIVTDVERLRLPMQKVTDFIKTKFELEEKADVVPMVRQG